MIRSHKINKSVLIKTDVVETYSFWNIHLNTILIFGN